MGSILGKCGKNCQKEQRTRESCLMISLRFEDISLHSRIMDIVLMTVKKGQSIEIGYQN